MAYDPDLEPVLEEVRNAITALGGQIDSIDDKLDAAVNDLNARIDGLVVVAPPEPTPTPTPTPTPPPTPGWEPAFPGDTRPGMIRWGMSYTSNGDPKPLEDQAGAPVGVSRTFWRIDQISKIVARAKSDHAKGRLPWVSIKLNRKATWKETAAGKIDADLNSLISQLGALDGPVWFTAHHEPEGGNGTPYPDEGQGSEGEWRDMQRHVRALIDASGVTNIAFAGILMAWTFDSRSGRNPDDWWVDGIWDFAGIDSYVEADATSVMSNMWNKTVDYYTAKGLRIAVGEWGNKDHGPSGAAEMQEWYDHLRDIGSPGAAYFNTSLNGGVPLTAEALAKFLELMGAESSVNVNEA